MQKYMYTFPLLKGLKSTFNIIDEHGTLEAEIQRYYPSVLNVITEVFLTGWEVNIKVLQNDNEYLIKEHFHWVKNEWTIFENGSKAGSLTDIKKFELGSTKEITYKNKKFYYFDRPLDTQTLVQDEMKREVAIIDYKLFDLSRKKQLMQYSDELPNALLVGIDYLASLKKK
ncbi:hypothetical protein [Fictibacillus sp. JL2B1089]|uniref:tubby C-terminal domain-like protein n=1 Tax=Fictibacillus sp. JL2B1089 TaxID=3399565 RepID=UPI003A8787C7